MSALEIIKSEKICTKCGESNKLDSFYKNRAKCISCHAKINAEWKIKTKKQCPACGDLMNRTSKNCRKCFHKTDNYKSKLMEATVKRWDSYKHKESFCVDCGTRVGLGAKFCVRHKSIGKRNAAWKGGVTIVKERIRDLFEYRQWRSDIFTRDKFTCTNCGNVGGKLQAHHIIPMNVLMQKYEITSIEAAKNCSELFNLNNGVTLCEGCHRDLHKGKGYKYEQYFN